VNLDGFVFVFRRKISGKC